MARVDLEGTQFFKCLVYTCVSIPTPLFGIKAVLARRLTTVVVLQGTDTSFPSLADMIEGALSLRLHFATQSPGPKVWELPIPRLPQISSLVEEEGTLAAHKTVP